MIEDSPMFVQYNKIKRDYPDTVLFYRLGDFYEMFDDDAVEVGRLLNLTMTSRVGHPMCGVPYHAAAAYISRLLKFGKKIAVCEQVSMPVQGKGLAERKVVEVITPGTAVDEEYLDENSNNYLAAFCGSRDTGFGFAYIDVTTGEFRGTFFPEAQVEERFKKEMGRVMPAELLIQNSLAKEEAFVQDVISLYPAMVVNNYPDWSFEYHSAEKKLLEQFGTVSLKAFGIASPGPVVPAAGVLVDYLVSTTKHKIPHVDGIKIYGEDEYAAIDDSTRKNLELITNLRDGTSAYTLYETLNSTKTSMGARLLRTSIVHPLKDKSELEKRLDKVEVLSLGKNYPVLQEIRKELSVILDIQRLASRCAMDKAHGKDLTALRQSLEGVINLQKLVFSLDGKWEIFTEKELETLAEISLMIKNGIKDEPSILLTEGSLIREGWSEDLDRLHKIKENSRQVLEEYLNTEKTNSGINNLKIRYNKIIGYFLEVSKGNLGNVPPHFIRRQSLVNGDRFTTDRLIQLETEINSASEKIVELEKELFLEIRGKVKAVVPLLLHVAREVASVDVFQSFANQAVINNWHRPVLTDDRVIHIRAGRHPTVEAHLPKGEFIPNDLDMNPGDCTFAMITGPNMAGKSTYLRQCALIILMAQIGSFVPCDSASISIVDRIFCRVGASDNLARGESTFLMEMNETANILRNATKDSFVIMDEVGRGTSTQDGLSLAWAISEYLLEVVKANTLFATHYHELAALENPKLKKFCLSVLEKDGSVVFLKKVVSGAASSSYGIHVAKLAGIPPAVIKRATEVMNSLDVCREVHPEGSISKTISREQSATELFSPGELVLDSILSQDIENTTPLKALELLAGWKKQLTQ